MFTHPKKPCAECPWRRDVERGRFPPERFIKLAHTANDMDIGLFACHKSADDQPIACAGFLLRGAEHNLMVRLAISDGFDPKAVSDGGYPLFENFREMAVRNGVDPDDPALKHCR